MTEIPAVMSRDFCQTVIETVGALIVVLDPAGRIAGFNKACERVTGYTFEEVRGREFFDLFLSPDEIPGVRSVFSALRGGCFPNTHENDWLTRNGERRRIAWSNAAIMAEDGTVEFVVGTGIDITERRKTELVIERAKREWEATFDAVPDLVALVGTDSRIVRVNRAMAERLGCHPCDLVGKRCCETLHGLACKPDWCLHRSMQDGGGMTRESREALLGGDFQITVTPLREPDGTLRGSVHVFRDITPLKQAEAARRREELARLDRVRMLGLVSVSLAHELNQPLTAILCNAQAAQRMMQTGNPPPLEEIGEILDDIVSDDKRAAMIIDGMRSMLEGRPLPAETLCMAEILREAEKLLRGEADLHQTGLCLDVADGLPAVRAGKTPLLQVLLNLVFNAFDAVAGLPPERRAVWIEAAAEPGVVRVSVHDAGPGVEPERMETIFEVLHTDKEHGLGMGLAISRSLVEAYGGTLRVRNHPEGGAVFTFTVPVVDRERCSSMVPLQERDV